MKRLIIAAGLALTGLSAQAAEPAWSLVTDASKVAYGSIKSNSVGEVNHFTGLTGGVSEDGAVEVNIDLTTVETWIDIRNERMLSWVFEGDNPTATIKAQVDMDRLKAMPAGGVDVVAIDGSLTVLDTEIPLETRLSVARLAQDRVMVSTDEMFFVSTDALNLDAGVTKLMEIANLSGITRTVPVTARLVFAAGDGTDTAAAPVAASATQVAAAGAGDPAAGKQVFRRCQACHVADKKQNRVGPHLVGIFGREAGSIEGFRYSDAMLDSGITWTDETLAAYLTKPTDVVPGGSMAFPGLRNEEDVTNLLAYLKSLES